jgi:hypothetical protein
MSSFARVTPECTVGAVLSRYPSTATIFHLVRLDLHHHADDTVREAAVHAGTDLGVLLSLLEASACASLAATGIR